MEKKEILYVSNHKLVLLGGEVERESGERKPMECRQNKKCAIFIDVLIVNCCSIYVGVAKYSVMF